MKKAVHLFAIGVGIAAGATVGADLALAAPQPATAAQAGTQCCGDDPWSTSMLAGKSFFEGWEELNGGAPAGSSLEEGILKAAATGIFMAAGDTGMKDDPFENKYINSSSGSNAPSLVSQVPTGTVAIDADGTSTTNIPAASDSGLTVDSTTHAPTTAAGTTNIDTGPVDCNGMWLVPPPGC